MTRKKLYRLLVFIGLLAIAITVINPLVSDATSETAYPGKPIKVIVPFKPGGGSDRIARIVDKFAEDEFGKPLVFQYKSGGGGHLGIGYLAKSRPDGYMIATFNTPDLALGPLTGAAQYGLNELSIIGQVAFDPLVFAAQSDTPFASISDFFARAISNPGKLRLGISQPKGGAHLSTIAMLDTHGIDVSVVLFAGGSELATAVLGGQVDVGVAAIAPFLGSVERVKLLAVTGDRRHPQSPETLTMNEQGYPMDAGTGRVFLAPEGIDPAQLQRLRTGFKRIFERQAFTDEIQSIGNEPLWLDGERVDASLAAFSKQAVHMIEKYDL